MVKAAGLMVTLDKVPAGEFWSQKYMQAPFFISWWPVFSDPNAVLPDAFSAQGDFNESGWSDPKVDELIAAGRAELDVAQQRWESIEFHALREHAGLIYQSELAG